MIDGDGGFAQEDDPFAGSDFDDELMGEETTPQGLAEQAASAPTSELPVVDREGAPVDPTSAPTDGATTAQPAETSSLQAPASDPVAETAPTSSGSPEAELRTEPEETTPQGLAEQASVDAAVDPSLVADPSEPQETERAAEEAPVEDPSPASGQPSEPSQPSGQADPGEKGPIGTDFGSGDAVNGVAGVAEPLEMPEPGEAPPPELPKGRDGRVTHRNYAVFTPVSTSKDTFRRVTWYEKDGDLCTRGTPGAKRQKLALARDADGARAIAYHALGGEGAIELVAVSESNFQVVTVEPDEPKPSKRKLKMTRR